jgi:hypothetical protein
MNKFRIIVTFSLWLLTTSYCLGCECMQDVLFNCMKADFIAEVKVVKTYKNEKDNHHFYKIDIEPIALYKGEKLTSLYVYGSNGSEMLTSCDLYVPENTTWLVYATKAKNGNFEFGMCTSSRELGISSADSIRLGEKGIAHINRDNKRERQFLSFFKENQKVFDKTSAIYDASVIGIDEFLKTYKGVTFDNNFGAYKIVFNEDYTVKKVIIIKKFNKDFDKKLIETIKKLKFDYLKSRKKVFKEGIYVPLVISYYDESKFLSDNIL